MPIQELREEIERGKQMYRRLQEIRESINFKSGIDFGPSSEGPIEFWFRMKSKKGAKILADKCKKILYRSPITETLNCFILKEEIYGLIYCVAIYFPLGEGNNMKDLFEEYQKVRERYPNLKNLSAYNLIKTHDKLLTTEEIHILSRAHSASRSGEWQDTESTLYEKRLLRERYNIGPEWHGPMCV